MPGSPPFKSTAKVFQQNAQITPENTQRGTNGGSISPRHRTVNKFRAENYITGVKCKTRLGGDGGRWMGGPSPWRIDRNLFPNARTSKCQRALVIVIFHSERARRLLALSSVAQRRRRPYGVAFWRIRYALAVVCLCACVFVERFVIQLILKWTNSQHTFISTQTHTGRQMKLQLHWNQSISKDI